MTSNFFFQLPQYIILPAIYNLIVYWMAGELSTDNHWKWVLINNVLLSGLVPNIWTFLFATLICALMSNVAISICKRLGYLGVPNTTQIRLPLNTTWTIVLCATVDAIVRDIFRKLIGRVGGSSPASLLQTH